MLLEVTGLTKEFANGDKKMKAVDNASLKIKSGEFISILGHSGSGKSTFFHLITGLLKPTNGKVVLDELCVNDAGEKVMAKLRNQKLGYILQEQNLLKNFTVLENVCIPNALSPSPNRETFEKAELLLTIVGLLPLKSQFPNELSGGEARRVSIARALINNPSILIADEPTSNLDAENSTIVMKLLKKISKNGTAVLVSTHDNKFIEYSDKVYFMDKGRLEEHAIIKQSVGY